jgi:hypothetical protein
MSQLFNLDTFAADSGNLTVIEKVMPGSIKRLFYIYEIDETLRVGHRYRTAWHAFICLNGSCRIYTHDGTSESYFMLDDPQKCLVIAPKDWHRIETLTEGAFLLVYSNEYDDPADVIVKRTHGL